MVRGKAAIWIAALAAMVAAGSTAAYALMRRAPKPAEAVTSPPPPTSGGGGRRGAWGYAGAGWSLNPDTEGAVAEAVAKAASDDRGGLTMLFYTPQHDPHRVADAFTRARQGRGRGIAMTTHDGVLTADGYHAAASGVVGALRLDLSSVSAGLGAASFDEAAPEAAARLALSRAMADAHRSKADRPSLLVMFCSVQHEEAALAAIAGEVGADVPLLGGTAAGLVSAMERRTADVKSSMILDDLVIDDGVAITAFYSSGVFGLAYGGGFDRGTGKGGVITSSDVRLIKTIDHRPAVDVYDEWLGGRLRAAAANGENVQNMLALYPLVQTITKGGVSHNQFVRAWPSGDPAAPGSLRTGADVHDGEVVYASEGSENILLNHFASLPRQARLSAGDDASAAGLFFYCAGALQTIPRDHRGVLASLVQRSMGDIPWLGLFTWGEQGSVPGIGYEHGNLMASTVLFPSSTRD